MKQSLYSVLIACLVLLPLLATPAAAYDQPLVNLGLTSFLDGGPPAGPGFYFTEYIMYWTADKLADDPVPTDHNAKLNIWGSLNQFIYQSDQPVLFGGKWGLDVIQPIASMDVDNSALTDNGGGLGDLLVGPFLQWDPIMGSKGPVFMHRIELQNMFPTGKYSHDKNLNPGSNFYSFNPYWAATFWALPELNISWRVHYLWNAKNDDPGGAYDDTQAGQVVHANFAVAYELLPKQLQVGLNGYYLKQVTDSQADGDNVRGREQVLGLGPGALYSFSQNSHLFFNAYFESQARYRPQGDRFVLRFVHHF
jgi:anthranilate 1,2-dioxygenase (deaminating, decarboxylating) large subunit